MTERYYAKKELADQDWKSQQAHGYENIPAGAEVEYLSEMTNFYGRFARVIYKGNLYYVKPEDIVVKADLKDEALREKTDKDDCFLNDHVRQEIKKAVSLFRCKQQFDMSELREGFSTTVVLEHRFAAAVAEKADEILTDVIKKAVDVGKIHTAVILDSEKIQEIFNRYEPVPVFYGKCGHCGAEVYRHFNECFCGKCGQKLKWEECNNADKEH